MSTTAEIMDALELAMARIGCPPGDNADADIYHRLSRALALLADMEREGERMFTESEVRVMVKEMVDGVTAGEELTLETIAAKHGVVLDPA